MLFTATQAVGSARLSSSLRVVRCFCSMEGSPGTAGALQPHHVAFLIPGNLLQLRDGAVVASSLPGGAAEGPSMCPRVLDDHNGTAAQPATRASPSVANGRGHKEAGWRGRLHKSVTLAAVGRRPLPLLPPPAAPPPPLPPPPGVVAAGQRPPCDAPRALRHPLPPGRARRGAPRLTKRRPGLVTHGDERRPRPFR